MIYDLKQAAIDIENSKEDIINRLVKYITTDTLLFWSPNEDLKSKQKQIWEPYLRWFGEKTGTTLNSTDNINVDNKNAKKSKNLKYYFFKLSTAELTSLYLSAIELNSVILGLYFAIENANIENLINTAFLEEKFQAERWGENIPAEEKYKDIFEKLSLLRHTFVQ